MTVGITFLCSGGGGNLRMLQALIDRGALPGCALNGVVADRECQALDWARSRGLPSRLAPYSRAQPAALRAALAELAPGLIVTTIHKILDEQIVATYEGRLVNLHYSLLPAFGGAIGMEPVNMALAKGCRLVGATAHRVTAELDAGPILAQACVAVEPAKTTEALYDAVFRCGSVALATAIDALAVSADALPGGLLDAGQLSIMAGPGLRPALRTAFGDGAFWESLR